MIWPEYILKTSANFFQHQILNIEPPTLVNCYF